MTHNASVFQDPGNMIDKEEVIAVVRDLVRIPSINPPGEERQVAEYVVNYLVAKGLSVKTQEVAPGRINIVARLKGSGNSEALMFTGHMDVVPVSEVEMERWEVDPFSGEIKDGLLYGRGAADMKGGLGAAMVAMAALAEHGIRPSGDIALAVTVDEEDLMRGVKALIQTELVSDAAGVIVCEPTDLTVQAVSRGRTWAEVTVRGRSAHASIYGAGANAIDRAVALIHRMQSHSLPHQQHPLLGESFWQTTMIRGGIEPAIVPDWCTLTVDARLVPGQVPDDIWHDAEMIIASLKNEIPDFKADVHVIERREPWETPRGEKVVRVLEMACNSLGLPVVHTGMPGTTDGTIFRRLGIPPVIFGPGATSTVHQENERVPIRQLIQATEVYALAMCTW